MRTPRLGAMLTALVVLAACTSTHDGRGERSRAPSGAAGPTGTSRTGWGAPSLTPPPADLVRSPVHTAIGDPVTADLCAAMGLDALRGLGAGLTPSFDERQYPPGCSVTVRDGATSVQLSVYATRGRPSAADGRTTRVQSGLTVYAYKYDSRTGGCERDIVARGVRLVVDAYGLGSTGAPVSLSCAGTDAMANRLAAVVAAGDVPRLAIASPSLSALDGCKVVKRAAVGPLSAFAGSRIIGRGFDVNCELKTARVFLFLTFEIAASPPADAKVTTVEGHRLFRTEAAGRYCTIVSTQGATPDGRYEQMSATATTAGAATPAAGMCGQTALLLARYLTAAGLT